MPQTGLPPLRQIELPILQDLPELKIRTDQDVEVWKSTKGYADYLLFLHRLSEAVVDCTLPLVDPTKQSQVRNYIRHHYLIHRVHRKLTEFLLSWIP
jgi:hypothetical protein